MNQLIGRRTFLAEAVAQRFYRDIEADSVSELETVGDRLGWIENPDRHTLQFVFRPTFAERPSGEAVSLYRWPFQRWHTRFGWNCDPYFSRKLRCEVVKKEGR